jgi:hypothetical protein
VIEDTTSPDITVEASDTTVLCDGSGNNADLNSWLANQGGAEASDICRGISWSYDLISETDLCGLTGDQTYRFTVVDACGNTSITEATFTIIDTTAPVITVEAADITVQCDGGSNNAAQLLNWLNNNGFASATEECSGVNWSNNYGTFGSGACDGTGGVEVTFYATDDCGNVDSTAATLTIVDSVAPVWSIDPVDLTLECSDTIDPYNEINQWLAAAGFGDAQDSCSVVVFSNDFDSLMNGCGMGSLTGSATVTFTATDACGNSSTRTAVVEVVDMTEPRITRPAIDTVVECDGFGNQADLQAWLDNNGGAESEDVCGAVTWNTPVLLQEIAGCGQTVEFVYSFSSTDACGNVSDETVASFIIEDTTPPAIDPDAMDEVVECDGLGNTADLDAWLARVADAGATDACGDVTWEWDLVREEDACGITGTQVYRFTATDECGNSTVTEGTFTIEDTEAPVISGGEDYTGECDQSNANNNDELISWLNNNGGATADDVCGNFTWSNNFDVNNWVDGCNDSRSIDVTFFATDDCGNVDSVTLNFSTGDNLPPVFTNCPRPPVVVDAPIGWCSAYVNFSLPLATDNCGIPIVEQTDTTGLTTGDLFPVGLTTLEFTATDSCGNSSVCTLKIVVNDFHVPPVIECPEDVQVFNDLGECGAVVNDLSPVVEDNCPDNVAVVYRVYD